MTITIKLEVYTVFLVVIKQRSRAETICLVQMWQIWIKKTPFMLLLGVSDTVQMDEGRTTVFNSCLIGMIGNKW